MIYQATKRVRKTLHAYCLVKDPVSKGYGYCLVPIIESEKDQWFRGRMGMMSKGSVEFVGHYSL